MGQRLLLKVLALNQSRYDSGDVALVHPEADPEDVTSLLKRLDWLSAADDPIRVESFCKSPSLYLTCVAYDNYPQLPTFRHTSQPQLRRRCDRY